MRLWPAFALFAVVASGQKPGPPPKPLPPPDITYRAKIALDGDLPLPATPLVITRHEQKDSWACHVTQTFGNGNVVYHITPTDTLVRPDLTVRIPDDCPVTIRLEGYETTEATLHDGGVIVLSRAGAHEGAAVSAPSLGAPKEAQKAYAKGVQAASKQKWSQSQAHLERALAIYSNYAPAWTDLGEAQRALENRPAAKASYERAVQADPKYARAYVQAARLALDEGRTEEGLRLSESAIALDSVEFPEAYFYSGVANYNLGRLDAAGQRVRRAIELDTRHRLPRAEHLLGCVLARQGEYRLALEHLHEYVKLSPLAADTVETLQLIRALEQVGSTP
jgi:Tfp pilus assembly protein PilF